MNSLIIVFLILTIFLPYIINIRKKLTMDARQNTITSPLLPNDSVQSNKIVQTYLDRLGTIILESCKKLQMKFILWAFMFELSKILKSHRWDNIQRKFMRHGRNHLGSLNVWKTSAMMKSTWMAKIKFSLLMNSTCFCITIMKSKCCIIWHCHYFIKFSIQLINVDECMLFFLYLK